MRQFPYLAVLETSVWSCSKKFCVLVKKVGLHANQQGATSGGAKETDNKKRAL